MAGNHGGVRPGAGRKPKGVIYQSAIREAEGQIRDRLPFLIGQLMQLAEGVLVEEVNAATGVPIVYRTPPDRKSCEYLVNRVMGTPVARNETGDPGEFDRDVVIEIATVKDRRRAG